MLGHEERGFSAWLADNLDLLADALDLPGLELVERESGVGPYRVDILAVAEDDTDEGLPVVVENQYGGTNHDHLGVTYLAGQQRALGVWIAERFSDPHLAAVEFLNRTSDESVGYALVAQIVGALHRLRYGCRPGCPRHLSIRPYFVPGEQQLGVDCSAGCLEVKQGVRPLLPVMT